MSQIRLGHTNERTWCSLMKNIVICFDGTWNTVDADFPTNVVKTAQLVLPADERGVGQVVFYDEGVGSLQVAVGNSINSYLGGAFGVGLMDNIERAYRFLTFNYAPGDRVFVFGFSRGAFSARSFGGLIRTCGVLHKHKVGKIKDAIKLYQNRDRQAGADAEPCVKFRNENSFASFSGSAAANTSDQALAIEYMGLWDTVGALGIPGKFLLANAFNRRYQFHDLALSRMVRSARHAVSIDERRSTFAPTLWSNLDELNGSVPQIDPDSSAYQQVWFPGDHASVGGGGNVNGLWQAALVWVVEGARHRGLAVDTAEFGKYARDIDHRASIYCMKTRTFTAASLACRRWRDGPRGSALSELADVTRQRISAPAEELFERRPYRPRSLQSFVEANAQRLAVKWR